ncbi:MAG: hydroxymethylglutaryl-CoA reductase, degradative [Chloroflexi bacterium]|nr:MAG: hydroxymethylglutaryl-CoA reductase, degradative [Phototrophicales bacterium]RMF80087.1 MAG: hydroxymethylglutaryl-CoA reductase, degradative [Chloroflexota bacterium]
MSKQKTSRLPGFYKHTWQERAAIVAEWADLTPDEQAALNDRNGLDVAQATHLIENVIGVYTLPLGIATNFLINDRDYLIPMVIEEPSVVAAVSNAAKLFRAGGGFITHSDEPVMIGQIQVMDVPDLRVASDAVLQNRDMLLAEANRVGGSIVKRGGGAQDIDVRIIEQTSVGSMLIVHLLYDTRDAMGANAINTAVERIAPHIAHITGGRVNLRILSNLTDRRKASAQGTIPAAALATNTLDGAAVVRAIVEAGVFAEVDSYRAATHNKGIMNGIDPVIIATGNDWRAIEAGAHAYAARNGQYTSLTQWWQDDDGNLRGSIELPLAVGIVGGMTRVHPTAKVALKILGVESARELAEVIAAVGLAQNLAAMRALATEGIQRGHMSLHARQLAIAAGATGDMIQRITQMMIEENNIRLERAKQLITELEGA